MHLQNRQGEFSCNFNLKFAIIFTQNDVHVNVHFSKHLKKENTQYFFYLHGLNLFKENVKKEANNKKPTISKGHKSANESVIVYITKVNLIRNEEKQKQECKRKKQMCTMQNSSTWACTSHWQSIERLI